LLRLIANLGSKVMSNFEFDFSKIVECAQDVIIVTKAFPIKPPGPEIVYVNTAFTKLTGYTFDEIVGKNPRVLQSRNSHDHDNEVKDKIVDALTKKTSVTATIKNYSKDGREYWLEMNIIPLTDQNGEVTHFAAIERDVTARKIIEQQLQILAKTDPLTNLLNRRAFDERLTNELSRYHRTLETFAVLMLDVNSFKEINDTHGHTVGDQALVIVADSCNSVLRTHDTIARFGGDEFVVLLPNANVDTAEIVADKIKNSILESSSEKLEFEVNISIGIAEVNIKDEMLTEILRRADESLYDDKKRQ